MNVVVVARKETVLQLFATLAIFTDPRPVASSKPTPAENPKPVVSDDDACTRFPPATISWKLQVAAGNVTVVFPAVPLVAWHAVVEAAYCAFANG